MFHGALFSLLLLHFTVTSAMAGLIWMVQLVHYPLMTFVGKEEYPSYHAGHTRRTARVVAPLMLTELGTAALLRAGGLDSPLFLWSLALLALCWGSTAFIQVPLHRRLEKSRDIALIQRLVLTNWIRTLAWTLRVVCLALLLNQAAAL